MRRKLSLAAAVLVAAFTSGTAHASIDAFGYGDGHTGAYSVFSGNVVVNAYAALTADVNAGDGTLTVDTPASFQAGDLVLVLQWGGLTATSGSQTPVDLTTTSVGRVELARVSTVGTTLSLTAPMVHAFPAASSEVVRVPEYTLLQIISSAIVATPFDGQKGGVVAFFANQGVVNYGTISADGAGFPGGAYAKASTAQGGCAALDDISPSSGAKGGGVASGASAGRGDLANGAGGGDCLEAGGAGGAGAGAGGNGGASAASDGQRMVGGLGGAAMSYPAISRFVMGGGGGAGQGNVGDGSSGASGGGIVAIRTTSITGTGSISASGLAANGAINDGAGGGGGGGTVYLRVAGPAACSVGALGGAGSNGTSMDHGTSGGGGGGRVVIQTSSAATACPANVSGGTAGLAGGTGPSLGATGGANGAVDAPPPGAYCAGDTDCASGQVCDVTRGICVGCTSDADCTSPMAPACLLTGTNANTCVACTATNASACTGPNPVCLSSNACGCMSNADCPASAPRCDPQASTCVATCTSDADCTTLPFVHCDIGAMPEVCVECVTNSDCTDGLLCSVAHACVECTPSSTAACSASGVGQACLASGSCGCTSDSDCAAGRICVAASSTCVEGCRGTGGNACPAGSICSSTTSAPGTCSPGVDGGAPDAGAAPAENETFGGGGPGCSASGGNSVPFGGALAGAIAWMVGVLRRRRR